MEDNPPRLLSPSEQIRVQRLETRPDGPYVQEKPQRPLRLRRSLSPPPELLERPGRVVLDGYRRGGKSIERAEEEEYDRGIYRVREKRDISQSPPFEQFVKRSHVIDNDDDDDEFAFREAHPPPRDAVIEGRGVKYYNMPEYRDKHNMLEYRESYGRGGLKHASGSRPSNSRYSQEKHLQGNDPSLLMPPQVVRPPVNSGRSGRAFPSSSRNVNIKRREDEEVFLFENSLHPNTRLAREYYDEEDHPLSYTEDVYDPMPMSSHSKDFGSVPSRELKDNFVVYRKESLQPYGFGRRRGKYSDFGDQDGYSGAPPTDFARDPEHCSDDRTLYHYDSISSARREHPDYHYHERGRRDEDHTGHRSELYKQGQPNDRGAYTNRDSLRPSLPGFVVDEVEYVDNSRKNLRENNSRGQHSLKREPLPNYGDIKSKLLAANDRDGEPFYPGANEFGMKLSSDSERTHLRGDYGFGREAGPLSHKERLKRLQLSEGDPNMYKVQISPRQRLKAEEQSNYEPTERMLKRRHPIVEEMSRHNDRNISLSDRIPSRQVQEFSSNEEQWKNENLGGVFSSKRLRYSDLQYQKSGRTYEERSSSRSFPSDDWGSSYDVPRHVQRRAIDHYTTGDENVNIKGRLRPYHSTYHNTYPMERRNDFYKSDRTWKRDPDNQYDLTDNGIPLEDTETPVMSDLPEDGDEFKQVVGNLFLQYAKRLHENPSTRRRYKEEGNAGTLFCIVCGRHSKDFLDTRSLATHTFMSHRFGKRAHHLALNKAICVLMGWKSVITSSGACVYEVLPETEALSLKEDLILWPPLVIIHNSSFLYNDSDGHVVTIEHMEALLRGLGFSGGKIKVRYGRHGNDSILVVKFLPTFSGLQEAEKLHKYYLEGKRGRKEFQKFKYGNRNTVSTEAAGGIPDNRNTVSTEAAGGIPDNRNIVSTEAAGGLPDNVNIVSTEAAGGIPDNRNIVSTEAAGELPDNVNVVSTEATGGIPNNKNIVSNEAAGDIPEEKVDEKMQHILYGYMGIAEDLDKLDFDMKRKSAVKSKKDIQDIADAPLKTE